MKVVRLAKNLFDFGGTRSRGIIRTENVSILIKAGDKRTVFPFPDIPNLRNARIFGVETPCNILEEDTSIGYFDNVRDINNIPYIAGTPAINSFVTFVGYNGEQFVKNIPYMRLSFLAEVLIRNNTFFFGQRINWPKSYVQVNSNEIFDELDKDVVYNFIIYYSYDANTQNDDLALPFGDAGQFQKS